jgi:hypothetical protein
MSKNISATWNIELMCECPHCEEYVNLLDYCDFWVDRRLDVCEWGTERSKNVEAICPECNEEFVVDLEY